MNYSEVKKDLFTVPEDYHLAHCISADAKMGAGIAVQFKKRFDLSETTEKGRRRHLSEGTCYRDGRVLNLITKKVYWSKPTYMSFEASLQDMRRVIVEEGITKVAMPRIGAGLDRLEWATNRETLHEVFGDLDIEILVCYQD